MRTVITMAFVACLRLTSSTALAQQPVSGPPVSKFGAAPQRATDAETQAQALLIRGNELYTHRRHLAALEMFQRAYAVYPGPRLHYSIAQAFYALGRRLEALAEYELVIRDVPEHQMPIEWKLAKNRIVELQQKVSAVVVQSNVTDAVVVLDGHQAGTIPLVAPVRALPGHHVLIVSKPGFEQQVIELTLGAGETTTRFVKLLTEAEAIRQRREFQQAEARRLIAEQRLVRERERARRRTERARRYLAIGAWASWGISAASAVAAGTLGGLYWREKSKVEDVKPGSFWTDVDDHYDRGQTYRQAAAGAAITAGVTAITGTVLILVRRRYRESDPTRERLRLTPAVSPQGSAVTLELRF